MKNIIFDVMGNDNGVEAAVLASQQFLELNSNYQITLVGDETEIKKYLDSKFKNIVIVHEPNVSKKGTNLRESTKEQTSMNKALDLLKEDKGDAVLSSGDSGSYLAAATFKLKRLENVSRPAFMPMIPQLEDNKFFLLLDAGANLEVKASYFLEWAKISSIFYTILFGNAQPKIGLLNIGTEDYKGLESHIEANKLLQSQLGENYQGFIESRNLLDQDIDIVLSDGYAGNVALKAMEGTIMTFSKLLRKKLTASFIRKIAALILKPAFKEIKEKFDYRNVGAAWVVGVKGVVLKSHGSSDQKAYIGALNQVKKALENDVLNKIETELKKMA
ncbi:phosphate acyltransferase PlsX [Mycoplasma iguanae]|uniref:Phosphate acyltransferase n=1 Tax=Mycoplasma iguanae TaxID=292461 RepID=A0ABY5RBN8_9MOLU|nr:phosphate acyltransferase PlsX [Mycoplasma iguanae]UVD81625.1 phosphate acyltransferase PlsX [Mycoplasma iguanae]